MVISILIKVIIFSLCLICLVDKTKILKRQFDGSIFLFFTNLSALLCLFFYGIDIWYYITFNGEGTLILNLKGAIVLYTFVTMIVYNFVLVPKHRNTGINHSFYNFQDTTIHCIIPVLTLLDWLLLSLKKEIIALAPIVWLSVPLLYFAIAIIKGKLKLGNKFEYADSFYPYFFIDIDQIGFKKVMTNFMVFLLIFGILGYIIFFIDYFVFQR